MEPNQDSKNTEIVVKFVCPACGKDHSQDNFSTLPELCQMLNTVFNPEDKEKYKS